MKVEFICIFERLNDDNVGPSMSVSEMKLNRAEKCNKVLSILFRRKATPPHSIVCHVCNKASCFPLLDF